MGAAGGRDRAGRAVDDADRGLRPDQYARGARQTAARPGGGNRGRAGRDRHPGRLSERCLRAADGRRALLPPLTEVPTIAFADLFLEDIRAYREERLTGADREAVFPVWGRDTGALAREFIAAGFEAVLACVDPAQIDPSFVGRPFDEELLADLPPSADPCGENGEFHTFVHAGPIFEHPIEVELGEAVTRDGFAFQDLLPKGLAAASGHFAPEYGGKGFSG